MTPDIREEIPFQERGRTMTAPETESTTQQLQPLFPAYLKAIASFISRDQGRPILTAVHVDGETVVATDSYRLVKITYKGMDANDFPTIAGERPSAGVLRDVSIDGAAFMRAIKTIPAARRRHFLPVLNSVAVMKETADTVSLGTTDLESSTVFVARKELGEYPAYGKLFPVTPPRAVVTLDARYLVDMAKAVLEFGAKYVTIETRSPLKPVVFRAKNGVDGVFEAIQMPVRDGDNMEPDPVWFATDRLRKVLVARVRPGGMFTTKTAKELAIANAHADLDALLTEEAPDAIAES